MSAPPRHDQGFTLIELLVVMIIIGILAAIAVPVYLNQRQKAFETTMRSDLRSVATEMETFSADDDPYPTVTTAGNIATLTPVSGAGTTIHLSVKTVITSQAAGAAPGTYCLKATTAQSSAVIYFDSDKGGLLLKGVPCS